MSRYGSNREILKRSLVFVVSLGFLYLIATWTQDGVVVDERYHVPTAERFAQMMLGRLEFSLDYNNSLGPFFYALYGLWSLVSGELWWQRLLTLLIASSNIVLFSHLIGRATNSQWYFAGLGMVSGPWFMLSGTTVHGEQVSVFLMLMSLFMLRHLVVNERESTCGGARFAGGALALALTPLARLHFIFLIPTLVFFSLWRAAPKLCTLALVFTIVPLLALWAHWGWITPPSFREEYGSQGWDLRFTANMAFRPVVMYAYIGLYAAPWAFFAVRDFLEEHNGGWGVLVLLMGSLLLSLAFPLGVAGPIDGVFRILTDMPASATYPFTSSDDEFMYLRCVYGVGLFSFAMILLPIVSNPALRNNPIVQVTSVGMLVYSLSVIPAGILFVERYFLPAHVLMMLACFVAYSHRVKTVSCIFLYVPFAALGWAHALLR